MKPIKGEEWRPVVGWEDTHEVSNKGRVRSRNRYAEWSKGRYSRGGVWVKGRLLQQKANWQGRPQVNLTAAGRQLTVHVHRLVLTAFRGPRPDGMVCRHLDGDPTHNCLENLAWGTLKENSADMIRHGTAQRGDKHPQAKRTADEVRAIRAAHAGGEPARSISDRTGTPLSTVKHIINRYSWRHLDTDTEGAP